MLCERTSSLIRLNSMSSSPHNSYKSQLLSFLVRQSRKWGDRIQRAFRYTKVATDWGVQTLAYSAYGAFQRMWRSAAHLLQVGDPLQQGLTPQESPVTNGEQAVPALDLNQQEADSTVLNPATSSLDRVLATARSLALDLPKSGDSSDITLSKQEAAPSSVSKSLVVPKEAGSLSSPFAKLRRWLGDKLGWLRAGSRSPESQSLPVEIRALASSLETRRLVLVAADNQILDVLTGEQQQKLEQRILWEIAHSERYAQIAQQVQTSRVTVRSLVDRLKALPLRQKTQPLVDWVKRQSSAIAAHLKPQSALSDNTLPQKAEAPSLQGNALPSLRPSFFAGQEVRTLLGGIKQSLVRWLQHGQAQLQQQATTLLTQLSPGERNLTLPDSGNPEHPIVDWETDPWLTANDLFSSPQAFSGASLSSLTGENSHRSQSLWGQDGRDRMNLLPQGSDATSALYLPGSSNLPLLVNLAYKLRHGLSQLWAQWRDRPVSDLPPSQGVLANQADTAITTGNHISPSSPSNVVRQAPTSSEIAAQLDTATDWLEAQAMPMGYVQHPLERLLRWVDRGLDWIERKLASVWQWLRSLWS